MNYSFSPLKCNSWNCVVCRNQIFMLTKITWFYLFVLQKIPPLPTLKMNHEGSNANTNSPVYCIWWMMHFETKLSFHVWFSSSCPSWVFKARLYWLAPSLPQEQPDLRHHSVTPQCCSPCIRAQPVGTGMGNWGLMDSEYPELEGIIIVQLPSLCSMTIPKSHHMA